MITVRKFDSVPLGLILILFLSVAFSGYAEQPSEQTEEEEGPSVAEIIMEESDGNVDIIIDPELMKNIMEPPHGAPKKPGGGTTTKTGINKMQGYRIQIFSDGLKQSSLESRARARGNAVAAKFPKYKGQVYTYSSSPNWITRVGNFKTQAEANDALAELKRAFPSFAGEMRVVKSQISVIR